MTVCKVAHVAVLGLIAGLVVPVASTADPAFAEKSHEQALIASPRLAQTAPSAPPGIGAGGLAEKRSKQPKRVRELTDLRSARSETWLNDDGSLSVRQYAGPHFYRPAKGAPLEPIDTALARVGGPDSEVVGTTKNSWTVSLGVSGRVGGATQFVLAGGRSISVTPLGVTDSAASPAVDGDVATYRQLWPGVDVIDRVQIDGVKEDVVLTRPGTATDFDFSVSGADLRFEKGGDVILKSNGSTVARIPAPVVELAKDSTGEKPVTAGKHAPRFSRSANPTEASHARWVIADGGRLSLKVDPAWLQALPSDAFPVTVDPTFYASGPDVIDDDDPMQVASFSNTGQTSSTQLKVGRATDGTGTWDGAVRFALPSTQTLTAHATSPNGQPWQLTAAVGHLACYGTCNVAPVDHYGIDTSVAGCAATTYAAIRTCPLNETSATHADSGTDPGIRGGFTATDWFASEFKAGKVSTWIGLAADQAALNDPSQSLATIDASDIWIDFYFTQNLAPTTITTPAADATFATATPTLAAAAATPPSGKAAWYDFSITTSPGGNGAIVDSGWLSTPTWTVPAGALHDGVTYYAQVRDTDISPAILPGTQTYAEPAAPTSVVPFKVKLRLGDGGQSPTDTIGSPPDSNSTPAKGSPSPGEAPSSETVNMVNGNLALTVGTHSVQALAGPAGVTLSYNSIQGSTTSGANFGLQGDYYTDPNGAHTYPSGPVGTRVDSSINLTSQYGTPVIGGLPPATMNYLVRWTGTISLPAGSWNLGAMSSGGTRIVLDDASTPLYDDWAGANSHTTPTFANTALAGGHQYRIRVEHWGGYTHWSNDSWAQLWVQETSTTGRTPRLVPNTWLIPTASPLPPGWTMNPANLGGTWTSLRDEGEQVVLSGTSGETASFTRNADGTYQAPPANRDYLSLNGNNRLQLSTVDGAIYLFNADGTLASVSSAGDDLHPASLRYTYLGNPLRLTSITDPVSNREVTVSYGGDDTCPSANAAPAKMLCRISTWDGLSTDISYNTNGQLALLNAPGGQKTLFGYDAQNRLNDIRDALAADYVASGRSDVPAACLSGGSCPLDTSIAYDANNRVTSVTQPAPTPGATRPQRTYAYAAGSTTMLIAGQDASATWSRKVTYDSAQQILTSSNWNENPTRNAWDTAGRLIATVTPAGAETATVYDLSGNPTDVLGPAPASCFEGSWPAGSSSGAIAHYASLDDEPFTCGASVIPHTKTRYDENMTGLAATYWSNGQFAGVPALHTQASTGGREWCGSPDALCLDWSSTPPVPVDAAGQFSVRAAGTLNWPTSRTVQLELETTMHATLFIDGIQQLDVRNENDWSISETQDLEILLPLSAGPHRIQIDYVGNTSAPPRFGNGFALADEHANLPDTMLTPDYHLPTSTTDPDGNVTTTSYGDSSGPVGPWFGLPTATTQDPDDLALTTATTYETPSTTAFLRKLSTTLPAGNTTTDSYYGGADGPIMATCGVTASTPQGGQLKAQTDPAPMPTAPARVQQFVYDSAGRQVGRRVGTTATIDAAPWACTSYDSRGRVTQETKPATASAAARTITHAYGVGGNPLAASVTDNSAITVTATVDLLGRLYIYTDNSNTTSYTYNQAGQLTTTNGPQGVLGRAYNPQGRLAALTLGATGSTPLASATYDTAGQLTGVTYSGNTTGTFANDSAGRRVRATFVVTRTTTDGKLSAGTPAAGATAIYSLAGKVSSYAYPADATTNKYTYDAANRLVSATLSGEKDTYSYDDSPASQGCATPSAGLNTNRTAVTKKFTGSGSGSTTTYYCYDGADRLSGSQYTYDDHGNQTTDGTTTLTWDSSDRLASTTTGTTTTSYTFDPLDRTARVADNGTGSRYLYGGYDDSPIAVTDDGGTITQQIVPLPGGVTFTIDTTQSPAKQVWSYPDLHGDTNATLDALGEGNTIHYDPWGAPLAGTNVANPNAGSSAHLGAYGSHGKLTADTSGYVILGARALNPVEGRFLSVDPVFGGCANSYVYAFGDPINAGDLTGRAAECGFHCTWFGLGGCSYTVSAADVKAMSDQLVAGVTLSGVLAKYVFDNLVRIGVIGKAIAPEVAVGVGLVVGTTSLKIKEAAKNGDGLTFYIPSFGIVEVGPCK